MIQFDFKFDLYFFRWMVQRPASNCVIPYVFCSVYRTGNLSLLLSVFLIQPIMAQGGTSNIFVNPEPKKKGSVFFQQKDVQKRSQMAGKNSSQRRNVFQ